MPESELDAAIQEKTSAIEKMEESFKAFVDGLQKQYKEATDKKEKDTKEIQDAEFRVMKSVASKRGIRTSPQQKWGQWLESVVTEFSENVVMAIAQLFPNGPPDWKTLAGAFAGGFAIAMSLAGIACFCCMRKSKPTKAVKSEKQEEKADKQD
jgi:hypothetical protein